MTTLEKILYLLKENGLTASEFAKRLKISNSAVTDWKNGKTESYKNYIDEIAKILNVSSKYLDEDENETNIVDENISSTQRLLNFINKKKIKQKTLAKEVNIPYTTLNQWFKFDREIPQKYIIPICEFLGIDVHWFLTGNNSNNKNNESSISNKTDENIILEIYRTLTEDEKHEFMDFAYRMKFYHQEHLIKDKSKSKLETSNLADNQKFLA